MTSLLNDAELRHVWRGHSLFHAGEMGQAWRVETGVVLLERPLKDGQFPVQLGLPGDLIGVESLCAQPYAFSANALTAATVSPVEVNGEVARFGTIARGYMQQQRQALDMVRLRSGTIQQRLAHLLALLGKDSLGRIHPMLRHQLPPLKDLAQIVDSAKETVCRELNVLLPRHTPSATPTKSRWINEPGFSDLAWGL